MSPEAFARAAEPWIRKAVKTESYDPALIAAILQQRTEKLSDIPEKLGFFDTLPEYDTALYVHKKSKCDETVALDMLRNNAPACSPAITDVGRRRRCCTTMSDRRGGWNSAAKTPSSCGRCASPFPASAVTPGGAVEICHILGRAETLARIDKGIAKAGKMTK